MIDFVPEKLTLEEESKEKFFSPSTSEEAKIKTDGSYKNSTPKTKKHMSNFSNVKKKVNFSPVKKRRNYSRDEEDPVITITRKTKKKVGFVDDAGGELVQVIPVESYKQYYIDLNQGDNMDDLKTDKIRDDVKCSCACNVF